MLRRARLLGLLLLLAALPIRSLCAAARAPISTRPSRATESRAGRPAPPSLWAGLAPGPHAVGYRRLDASSSGVHVWFPARAGGEPFSFGACLDSDTVQVRAFLSGTGVASTTIDRLFGAPLDCTVAADPEGGSFPLILVAQGNGQDAADQVVLCEFLASHGYVVAATPSPMRRIPFGHEDQVGEFAELQASDLASAASQVAAILPADTSRIGVIGHSFGARSALLLAMRDPRVRAVVSLDGGIGTATAVEAFRRAPSFHADATLPAMLHFYETLDPFMKPDFALLRSLHTAGLTLRPTRGMHHAHFTTYGFAAVVFADIGRVTHATPETGDGLVAVARWTLAFLDRQLR